MNPLEALRQRLLSGQHGFGLTVTEATEPLDGLEFQVVMPRNRASGTNRSESPSDTSTPPDDPSADPMQGAVDHQRLGER